MEIKLHKLGRNELNVYSAEDEVSRKILRGRMLYDHEEQRTTFVENQPRGPRSKEIGRTGHARLVRSASDSNTFKITFKFSGTEKLLKETLISEVRNLVKMVEEEVKICKR